MPDHRRAFAGREGLQQYPGSGTGEAPTPTPGGDQTVTTELLARQVALLEAILQELQEQVQQGVAYPIAVNATSLVPVEVRFDPSLFTIGLTNDGPGTVQYRIPNDASAFWINLAPTEVITFSFIKGVVRTAGFRVQGAAAAVRVVGSY